MRGDRKPVSARKRALPGISAALSRLIFGGVLALALAGCESPPNRDYVGGSPSASAAGDVVAVGNDAVGEPCRYQRSPSDTIGTGARREIDLYCGNWRQPSARIFELSGVADQTAAVNAPAWRGYLDARFSCGAPAAAQVIGGASALLLQCTRRYGGWPHAAMTTEIRGRVFAADAVPSALPALAVAIASLGGLPAASAGQRPSEVARLIARGGASQPSGSGDLQRFYDLMGAGDADNNIDDPADAERSFREALAIQQRFVGQRNPGLAPTMMKLAAQIAHQRSTPEADRLLADAAALAAQSNDPLVIAQLEYYRAVTAAYEQRPGEAKSRAQVAETAFTRLLPQGIGVRTAPDPTGEALRVRGIDVEALSADPARTPEEETAILGLAETWRLLATLAQKAGDTTASTSLALRGDRLLAAAGLTTTSTDARALRLVANNEASASDYGAANSYSADAGRIFDRVVPGERPQALNMLMQGNYEIQRGDTGAALALFSRAGEILRRPGVVGVPPEAILPWLDALRVKAEQNPAERPRLMAEMFEAAQLGIGSRTALDIAQATARLAAGDPKAAAAVRSYQDKKRDFDALLAERDEAVAEQAPDNRIAAIDKEIAAAQKMRDEAESVILVAAPRYVEWSEKPASATDVSARLAANEALTYFFVSAMGSYDFIVKRDGVRAYRITATEADIRQAVNLLRHRTVARSGGLPDFDFAAAYRLYTALFAPGESDLSGVPRLNVVANGDLLRFPLAALVTQPGVSAANGDYRKVPWLVRRVALSYFPSPRVFVNLREQQIGAPGRSPFIGFGDFQPPTQAQLAASFPPDRCPDDFATLRLLPRLPGTKTEVETIGRELGAGPADIILGPGFTKARLAMPDLGRYRIVLLATHAALPDALKCQSEPSIIVSVPPRSANADPGFLTTSEIDKLKLDADLVVLSACETAGPDARTGESLSGLARAFFRAGAHGLLVTHWSIVSSAAVPLMIGTFPAAAGAEGTAEALRRAQLQMIDTAGSSGERPIELSYPNHWAAFALIGDGIRARIPGA
jgi:CHAT domain-containing protein